MLLLGITGSYQRSNTGDWFANDYLYIVITDLRQACQRICFLFYAKSRKWIISCFL